MHELKKEKGVSNFILIILVLCLVVIGYLLYKNNEKLSKVGVANTVGTQEAQPKESEKDEEVFFEDIPQDESTPDEINNTVLDELDELMKPTENDASVEDLSDLNIE